MSSTPTFYKSQTSELLKDMLSRAGSHLEIVGLEQSTENASYIFTAMFFCLLPDLHLSPKDFTETYFNYLCFSYARQAGEELDDAYIDERIYPGHCKLMANFYKNKLDPSASAADYAVIYSITRSYIANRTLGINPAILEDDWMEFKFSTMVMERAIQRLHSSTEEPRPSSKAHRIAELEHRIYELDEQLDKEKGKRQRYLFAAYTVLAFLALCASGLFSDPASWLALLLISVAIGASVTFLPLFIFAAVTDHLTGINDLQDRISALEKELHRLKSPSKPDDF